LDGATYNAVDFNQTMNLALSEDTWSVLNVEGLHTIEVRAVITELPVLSETLMQEVAQGQLWCMPSVLQNGLPLRIGALL